VRDESAATAIPVLLNARAGAGTDVAALRRAFTAQGLAVDLRVAEAGDGAALARAVDGALRSRPALLVAAGGDGTVAAVAARLVDGDTALGVLPLGTLNHFAADLGIPAKLEPAVQVIASGRRARVDVGEVNGRVFLNNSSLGLYPHIIDARERAQRRLHIGKWPALARATWQALRHPHSFTVHLEIDCQPLQRRTPFVFVGNNGYALEGFAAGHRPCLDDGVLSLYVLRPQRPWGFLRLALRALLGRVSAREDFEAFTARELVIEADAGELEIALDGEVARLAAPLRYRVRPDALPVLVPHPGHAGRG
jgi:diacylglycerol kinase family enzyme